MDQELVSFTFSAGLLLLVLVLCNVGIGRIAEAADLAVELEVLIAGGWMQYLCSCFLNSRTTFYRPPCLSTQPRTPPASRPSV